MNYLISHQSLVKSCQDAAVGHQSSFMCHVKRLSSEMFHPSCVLYNLPSLCLVSVCHVFVTMVTHPYISANNYDNDIILLRIGSLGSTKYINYVMNDPVLHVSGQEPSTSSKYPLLELPFLTHF